MVTFALVSHSDLLFEEWAWTYGPRFASGPVTSYDRLLPIFSRESVVASNHLTSAND